MKYNIETHDVDSPDRSYTLHLFEGEKEILTKEGNDYTFLKIWVGREYPDARQSGKISKR